MKLEHVKTVGELAEYLRQNKSKAGNIILLAIEYFSSDCRSSGKIDWKAVKERRQMGARSRFDKDTPLSAEVVGAINMWSIHPYHGRKLQDDPAFMQTFSEDKNAWSAMDDIFDAIDILKRPEAPR